MYYLRICKRIRRNHHSSCCAARKYHQRSVCSDAHDRRTAYLAGFELSSDQTQTLVYACLAGVSVGGRIKPAGIKLGTKLANGLIKKIPGTALTKINQKVGFRLITKFGSTGIINLGKLVPGVGAAIGGGLDLAETKSIGNRAYKWFFEGDWGEQAEEIDNSPSGTLETD